MIYLYVAICCFFLSSARYVVMTAAYYLVVYKLFKRQFFKYKIKSIEPKIATMNSEIYWALTNNINFSIIGVLAYVMFENGLLKLFWNFSSHSLYYHFGLIGILLLLHDAYFYWIHWLMHKTRLGRWARHDIHHSAINFSPWSAFSVHPIEGFLEVIFRLFTLALIPMHLYDFIFFEVLTFSLNIIGHSGYEFFGRNFASSILTKHNSCATFHYMHHQDGRTNLSLFFNHWDRIMGTFNPKYEEFYKQVMANRRISKLYPSKSGESWAQI